MRTEMETLNDFSLTYPLEKIAPLEKFLFLDIETTGFSTSNTCLYLIGCLYFEEGKWKSIQWLADTYEEEWDILNAFFQFSAGFTHLIHFNGNNFDLPYILQKCTKYGFSYTFDHFEGIDIYRRTLPYRELIGLADCKQKTIEKFLHISRLTIYNGGDLISVFHDYVSAPSTEGRYLLLLHNGNDLRGMLEILPILAYYDLFHGQLTAKKVQVNYFTDLAGGAKNMLFMKLTLPTALPTPLSFNHKGCFFKGEEREGYLAVPFYEAELKFFYANYKDYYYLPAEDCALHKSIASYVEKEYRKQATASTCYSRKKSVFLPQWEILVEPFFKQDYQSKEYFFEVTDEIKKNRQLFSKYAGHVLNVMKNK